MPTSSADFSAVSVDAEAAVQLHLGNWPHHHGGEGGVDVLGPCRAVQGHF